MAGKFARPFKQQKKSAPLNTLLLLKLTITPLLVAGMSLAARRFGPTLGGLIMGLPWMTAPVLFFLGLERGDVYLAQSAYGALLAVPSIAAFALSYAAISRKQKWPLSLLAAAVTFAISGWAIARLSVEATIAAALGIAALLAAHAAIAKPPPLSAVPVLPWWDIPARMSATAALVGLIAVSANNLGPALVGVVSSYPVILTVVITFTHQRWGRDAAMAMLRGVMLSLMGFVAFFLVVTEFVGRSGLVWSYVLAVAAGLTVSMALLIFNRLQSRRSKLEAASPRKRRGKNQ